jgi:uncharacterized protein YndB with AHSA1/START domain
MSEQQVASKNKESIVVESELAYPPEKVWRALTEPRLLEAWLMPNDIRAEVGHRFNFHTNPTQGWNGTIDCEVLEIVPHRLLVYSWSGGSKAVDGYGHRIETIVRWTLTPTARGGTKLHLEHSGFDPDSMALKAMGQGWVRKVTLRIAEVIAAEEGGETGQR